MITMQEPESADAFYKRLKVKLQESTNWPSKYRYKFIVKNNKEKIKAVQLKFDNVGAVITTKESAKGNYVSISVDLVMKNPDAVISKYKEVAAIGDVILL